MASPPRKTPSRDPRPTGSIRTVYPFWGPYPLQLEKTQLCYPFDKVDRKPPIAKKHDHVDGAQQQQQQEGSAVAILDMSSEEEDDDDDDDDDRLEMHIDAWKKKRLVGEPHKHRFRRRDRDGENRKSEMHHHENDSDRVDRSGDGEDCAGSSGASSDCVVKIGSNVKASRVIRKREEEEEKKKKGSRTKS
jgi:hypothetical protein